MITFLESLSLTGCLWVCPHERLPAGFARSRSVFSVGIRDRLHWSTVITESVFTSVVCVIVDPNTQTNAAAGVYLVPQPSLAWHCPTVISPPFGSVFPTHPTPARNNPENPSSQCKQEMYINAESLLPPNPLDQHTTF